MWTQEKWARFINQRTMDNAAASARIRRKDAREEMVLSIFKWLKMARADFPAVGARVDDTRLRIIAEMVADAFLAA